MQPRKLVKKQINDGLKISLHNTSSLVNELGSETNVFTNGPTLVYNLVCLERLANIVGNTKVIHCPHSHNLSTTKYNSTEYATIC